MKLILNIFLSLIALLMLEERSYSLTNYQIKNICKREKRESTCIKKLQEKRSNLQKGNFIEIPVIPFKDN